MEKKTIEEIRKSVLAYCEDVCPNEHSTAHLEIGMMKRMSMGSIFYWLHVYGLSTIAINAKSTDDHIFAAYIRLGDATRDAVAAKEDQIHDLRTAFESLFARFEGLESRNTALVAALEKIKKEHGLEHGFLRGERPVINSLGEFIDEALKANKKGGKKANERRKNNVKGDQYND